LRNERQRHDNERDQCKQHYSHELAFRHTGFPPENIHREKLLFLKNAARPRQSAPHRTGIMPLPRKRLQRVFNGQRRFGFYQ
jgi:hypothetical protein